MAKGDVLNIYIHTYTMEYDSAMTKDEYLPFTSTWAELEGILLSEISQSEKDNIWFHS